MSMIFTLKFAIVCGVARSHVRIHSNLCLYDREETSPKLSSKIYR